MNIAKHLDAMQRVKHGNPCVVCRDTCFFKCNLCNVWVHALGDKGKWNGVKCGMAFHNEKLFVLARCDAGTKEEQKKWNATTSSQIHVNKRCISNIKNELDNYCDWSNIPFYSTTSAYHCSSYNSYPCTSGTLFAPYQKRQFALFNKAVCLTKNAYYFIAEELLFKICRLFWQIGIVPDFLGSQKKALSLGSKAHSLGFGVQD